MNSIELIGGIRLSVPEKKGFARDLSTLLSPFCFVAGIVNPHLRHSMKKKSIIGDYSARICVRLYLINGGGQVENWLVFFVKTNFFIRFFPDSSSFFRILGDLIKTPQILTCVSSLAEGLGTKIKPQPFTNKNGSSLQGHPAVVFETARPKNKKENVNNNNVNKKEDKKLKEKEIEKKRKRKNDIGSRSFGVVAHSSEWVSGPDEMWQGPRRLQHGPLSKRPGTVVFHDRTRQTTSEHPPSLFLLLLGCSYFTFLSRSSLMFSFSLDFTARFIPFFFRLLQLHYVLNQHVVF